MKKVLVTGGSGQLGNCLKDLSKLHDELEFFFADLEQLDISKKSDVEQLFNDNKFDWCINCAAFTNVDLAEEKRDLAYEVNCNGVKNLAEYSMKLGVKMLHISTDFVFEGTKNVPYKESDQPRPINIYGDSKLKGEITLANTLKEHFIIRTSWLYSEHGNNFLKTMLRLSKNHESLGVVIDQVGSPTYAGDLADVIIQIIKNVNKMEYGVYHYSNEGVASWFDFAKAIFEITNSRTDVNPIGSEDFPTNAKRPNFSVLDKTKIKKELNDKIPYWRTSLEKAILKLNG